MFKYMLTHNWVKKETINTLILKQKKGGSSQDNTLPKPQPEVSE